MRISCPVALVLFVFMPYSSFAAPGASLPAKLQQTIRFEQNMGQFNEQVKFFARGSGGTLALTQHEAVLKFRYAKAEASAAHSPKFHSRGWEEETLHIGFVGGNSNPEIVGIGRLSGRSNYFGKDAQHTYAGVPAFSAVEYKDIYPGIDLWFLNKNGALQVAYRSKPNADLSLIRLAFGGAQADTVEGNLRLRFSHGERMQSPSSHDMATGTSQPVQFVALPNQQFALNVNAKDSSQAVLISPVLSFASTVNGVGDTDGYGITVDSSGNSYLAGETGEDNPGILIFKLDQTGNQIYYDNFNFDPNGSGNEARAIAVDGAGNAYITGNSDEDFFSNKPMIVSCLDYTPFVAELDPLGNLLYGTCVPAAGLSGYGIAIDAGGDAYIAGDGGFIMKIDQTPSIVWSTTLSSTSGTTTAFGIALDSSNNSYITGATGTGFPLVNPINSTGPGAFLSKLSPDGTSLLYSTYLTGTIGGLSGNGLAVDHAGNAYVTGGLSGQDIISSAQSNSNGFVTEVNAAGSAVVYTTTLGGTTGTTIPYGVALDASGDAYVTGITSASDFPTLQAIQPTYAGAQDAFVTELGPTGTFMYSTFLGGSGYDVGLSIGTNSTGTAYVTGVTGSIDFPTTNGSICDIDLCDSGFLVEISGNNLTFNPSGLAFGTVAVGSTSTSQTATLTNNGSTTLTISSITASGNFAESNTCGSNLAPAASCQITVSFSPNFAGSLTGSISVSSSSASSPGVLSLSGTAVAPVLVSPTVLAFGQVQIGKSSKTQTATITNNQAVSLPISAITASGDYFQSNTCGTILGPGASCKVTVNFRPTNIGSISGGVTISDSVINAPQVVGLTGTGTGTITNTVSLSPSSLSFGNVARGSTSGSKLVTLTNKASTTLFITSIAPSGNYSVVNSCPASLRSHASCTFTVAFTPEIIGTVNGGVAVLDNAKTSPQVVSLVGSGVVPVLLSPPSLTFSAQGLGTTSNTQSATIKNNLSTPLPITSIVPSGDFSETNTCPTQLAAGASCSVTISFTPTSLGSINGAVTFTDNSATNPQIVNLTGTGIPEALLSLTLAGTGSGAVTSNPSGISCSSSCSAGFSQGSVITLTATPNAGSSFGGWAGCDSAIGMACTVTTNYDRQPIATFN